MKKLINTLIALAAGFAALVSCQKEGRTLADLANNISADKAQIVLDGVNARTTVNITADGDWIAVAPDWVNVYPSAGTGNATLMVYAPDNVDAYKELMGPRKQFLYIYGADSETAALSIPIVQSGEAGLESTRHYSKITTAAEFEAGKAYLMVYELEGGDKAAKPLANGIDDNSYSYMFADDVKPEDGKLTFPNGNHGFTFEAAEGGYTIKQATGGYLWQSGTYANFYLTADVTKANVWTVDFLEDGTVKLTNISNNNKVMHFSTSYGNIEARDGAAAPYPVLYKDAAAPTDEVLSASDVSVNAFATKATIAVTANKEWKVRNHDSWITKFEKNEAGDAIEVSFDENASTTDDRTATFLLIGETTNIEVKLTQNKIATTVKDLTAQLKSTNSKAPDAYGAILDGAVVSYVNGNNAYIEDKTGAILLYLKNHGLKAGDTISGKVTGTGYLYNGLPEITALGTEYTLGEGGEIPATEMTAADLIKNYNANLNRRILLKGVKVTKEVKLATQNGEIEQGGKTLVLRAQNKNQILLAGSEGDIIVYPAIYNSTKQLSLYDVASQFTATKMVTYIAGVAKEVQAGATVAAEVTTNSTATITYAVKDETIATVAADGTITGVKEGETEVTASVAADGVFTAAETTFKVTVTKGAATDKTITLTDAILPKSYPTEEAQVTVSEVEFNILNVANFGSGMQFKKSGSYVSNNASLGKIKSIKITVQDGKTFYPTNMTLYVGTAKNPAALVIEPTSDETSSTYDLTGGEYSFFQLKNTSTYAVYLSKVEITYED